MTEFPQKIAIIGVGLIGGSIALGLKQHFGPKIKIFGSCHTQLRSKQAKKEGIIDEIFDIKNPHRDIGLYVLAIPILQIPGILDKLVLKIWVKGPSSFGRKNQILIMDVASTKEYVLRYADKILPENISFIATHPMAGSNASGFENADPNLFRNKPWIVCQDFFNSAQKIIKILGAKAVFMDAKTHDEAVSWASHLSLATSSILVNTIATQRNWKQIAQIASTGFRDTTRLASMDSAMKTDILLTNRANIRQTLNNLKSEIDKFLQVLNEEDNAIIKYLAQAKNVRDNWLANYFPETNI